MLAPGTVVRNKYRVERQIAVGGMSEVYLCRERESGKVYCMKEANNDPDAINALNAEAEVLSKIRHWGVPAFIDAFEWNGHFILVMQYIQGISLSDYVEKYGPQKEEIVTGWVMQICQILDYLHTQKKPIIHRDIKPANIMIQSDGKIALIDFGAAREYKIGKAGDTIWLGTRGYAAPEQYGGQGQSDGRSDIFALGCTIFYLFTGKNPYDVPSEFPMVRQLNSKISVEMENIIGKCVQSFSKDRFQSCKELIEALLAKTDRKENILNREVMASVVLAALGVFLIFWQIGNGVTNLPLLLVGIVSGVVAVILIVRKALTRRQNAAKYAQSNNHGALLQRQDNLGSGSVAGKGSGSTDDGIDWMRGIQKEDEEWYIASNEYIL